MHALQLRVLSGEDKGKHAVVVAPGGILGREEGASLQFTVRGVSLQHARLSWDGSWSLSDLNSTNGTFLGDERLSTVPKPLPSQGVFRLGAHEVGFTTVVLSTQPGPTPTSERETPPTIIRSAAELLVDETLIATANTRSRADSASGATAGTPVRAQAEVLRQPQLAQTQQQLAQTQQQLAQTQQQLAQTQQQLAQTQQQLSHRQQALQLEQQRGQELEKSLGATRRSNELLLAEQQKLQQMLHSLRAAQEEDNQRYAHLPAENLRLQALLVPLEDRLERLEERHTIQRELNALLARQKLRVEEETSLISTLWKEAKVLRSQNLQLESANRQLWNALLGLAQDDSESASSSQIEDVSSTTKA